MKAHGRRRVNKANRRAQDVDIPIHGEHTLFDYIVLGCFEVIIALFFVAAILPLGGTCLSRVLKISEDCAY